MLLLLAEGLIFKFFLALCRKFGAYHWKSGQAGPRTPPRAVAQNNENRKKVGNQICKLSSLK